MIRTRSWNLLILALKIPSSKLEKELLVTIQNSMEFIKNSAECHPEEPDLVLEMVWFGAGGLNRLSKVFL